MLPQLPTTMALLGGLASEATEAASSGGPCHQLHMRQSLLLPRCTAAAQVKIPRLPWTLAFLGGILSEATDAAPLGGDATYHLRIQRDLLIRILFITGQWGLLLIWTVFLGKLTSIRLEAHSRRKHSSHQDNLP